MRGNTYQYALISLGAVSSALFAIFFYREIFPEYKIYQDKYIAIEEFQSSYTHEPPPQFKAGVKQILLERSDKGNPVIDRCISCHVALEFPHFSPTKVGRDINGNLLIDSNGIPKQVPNDAYVWGRIDQKIAELEDNAVNRQFKTEGKATLVKTRLAEADALKALKIAHVGELTFDVTKVLAMHPLIGKETRPFEFHPLEEYGCTSCHSGNGRGITTLTAHGPVFDGQYEKEFMGEVPQFTEIDPDNDPRFSTVFNGKPGHELLFQTTPIFPGALIQAKCMQCHLSSSSAIKSVTDTVAQVTGHRKKQADAIAKALKNDKESILSLLQLQKSLTDKGVKATLKDLQTIQQDYTLAAVQRERAFTHANFLTHHPEGTPTPTLETMLSRVQTALSTLVGTPPLVLELTQTLSPLLEKPASEQEKALNAFLEKNKDSAQATGDIFAKLAALNLENEVKQHILDVDSSFQAAVSDQKAISAISTDIDLLTNNYHRGQELFISQSCYACHRISGYSRGGVGPELSQAGEGYPWFVKESIVWPQADLHTSTMPNYGLDHEELEDLVTFLLGQTGGTKAISPTAYKSAMQSWEAGRKLPWENPITPVQMLDLRYAMTVFATEGCAACHRLEGFDSTVGFTIEKQNAPPPFEALQAERNWFQNLFPEEISGTGLVEVVEKHAQEIDRHISADARPNGMLDEIDRTHPKVIESFYTPFKFASRAKNAFYKTLIEAEKDPAKKAALKQEQQAWQQRIHNLLFMYVQEYGLGRLIGPRPNWSGVFRTDEWLMEHFRNPAAHVPRSIMPIFPFDETKFYALTKMLDTLGIRNRNKSRKVWNEQGFNPAKAYEIYCSQCHGDFLNGNGPVALWTYPIPKNLRNGEFLRNLTRERVIDSIKHGVLGTPMPPWGEVAADKPDLQGIPVLTDNEIEKMTDWLFSTLPGGAVIPNSEAVPKWKYSPEDVLKELRREGNLEKFKQSAPEGTQEHSTNGVDLLQKTLYKGEKLWASLQPQVALPSEEPSDIFDVTPTSGYVDPQHYYIKRKYYTPENIQQGRQFFELNCAVCHGREGDGAGARAGTMIEAKPRMLTNLDWINTRDDLRLLRSIKYGVPGTSMTPWGDLTSSLQRLQLVMFIRTLTKERALREQLAESIYKAFDVTDIQIEQTRLENYKALLDTQKLYAQTQSQRKTLYQGSTADNKETPDFLSLYQQELDLRKKLDLYQKHDEQFLELKALLKNERNLFQRMGMDLIQNDLTDLLARYDAMIDLSVERLQLNADKLSYHFSESQEKAYKEASDQLLTAVAERIQTLEKEVAQSKSTTASVEEQAKLLELTTRLQTLIKLKNALIFSLSETSRVRLKEQQLLSDFDTEKEKIND